MLNRIILFSIKNKLIIGLFTVALIIWGGYSVTQLPIDAVPDITNNQVQILTVAPSQSAQDIERLVTFPIEQTMATIPGIEEVRSFSRFGLSVVTMVFKDNIDVYWARQQVSERLNEAKGRIPAGAGSPELAPVSTGLGEILQYVIRPKTGYENKYDAMTLRTIQDWIVRRQLLGTPGVADVSGFGGLLKQYEISLNPERLRSFNISVTDVFKALETNNQNTGGAYLDKKPNAYFIRSEGLLTSIDDISNVVVKTNSNGTPVLIRHVADVRFGHAIRYGAMTRNQEGEVVGGLVLMLKGANSSKVIASVKERIALIEKTLPEGVTIEPFLDRTKLVNKAIHTVTKNLAEGALIVIFVLVLLLGNLRAGLVVASVIPLAMLFAIAMMNLFGVSGNLMSLGAIDFGLIIDGAVIIVEATMHHLGLRTINLKLTQTEMDDEVYHSAGKIMSKAAFGEIIILIVYIPILALVGIEGKMFKPMAQTVSFAILGAFILSLTYIPMMSALCLSKNIQHKKTFSDRLIGFMHRVYDPVIRFAINYKGVVVSVAIVFLAASLLVFTLLGAEFIPTLDEGDFAVDTRLLTGSSLSETVDKAQQSAGVLLKNFPEVKEVVSKIGSAEIPTDPMPLEAGDLMIILKDRSEWVSASDRDELAEKMQRKLEDNIPGVTYGFQQPIQMRFNELMTGARQDVVIKVFGEDLDKLTSYANQIARLFPSIVGAQDLYVEKVTGLPQIVVKFHREKIAQFGLNIQEINTTINTAFAGQSAGYVYEGEKRFDLVVRLDQQNRISLDDVKNLYITAPNGNQLPLQQVADVSMVIGPNQIQRDDAKRRITVGFNVRGRDVESIVREVQQKIESKIKFEPGYYVTYGGTFKNLQEARLRLSIAVPVSLLLIFILLFFTFNSMKQSLLIFSAIPLSAIGGIMALWIRGMPFSISAGVGFIALFGVAVLNGIVLISEFNRLKAEGLEDVKQIVLRGTFTRFRPVIMTAAVASLGFLPMAISGSEGAEVQRPLATVVIGGLITATLLTLVVLPVLYIYFERISTSMKTSKIAMLVIALLSIPAFSQAQQNPSAITLEQAIQQSLKNNKMITSASLNIEQQKQLKRTATEIPKTAIDLMYGQYNSIARNDNNISIIQTIPFPTVFTEQAALGRSGIKAAEYKKAATENEIVFQVKQVYYQLLYYKSYENLLLRQDSIFNGVAKAATLRYTTGEGTLLEKTTAQTQANDIHNLLQQNKADQLIMKRQLQTLMFTTDSITLADIELEELKYSAFDTAAVSENPMLHFTKQQVDIASHKKHVEVARAMPDFMVGYFNQSLIGYQTINTSEVYFNNSKRFQGFQAGISIPLWFLPQAARVKAMKYNEQAEQANYESFEVHLQSQFSQASQSLAKNKSNLEYYKTSARPNADLIQKQSQLAYQKGDIGYAQHLFNMKQALTIYESYLLALNQYNQSIIYLEYLTGNK
ncbi:MAG TPA: CusA/CzcA family heavy metal efflux RND transporter [Cyclobacteriaceae bacterium]|nr:CusA/CzcA family heavy metal efflux RND transporter [Cyclobacteriaceae bacterium]